MATPKKDQVKKVDADRWTGMTIEYHELLGQYMRDVADRLGLRDWFLRFAHAALDDENEGLARVNATWGQRHAVVYVAQDFAQQSREIQRHAIVHELLHCTIEPMFARLRSTLPKVLGQPVYDVLWESIRLDAEYHVDATAQFLAPRFPLPGDDWPEDD